MPRLIHCSRCGELTEELTINKKIIKNCKKCRDAHNNKCKKIKEEQEETERKSDTPEEQPEEQEQEQEQEQAEEQETEEQAEGEPTTQTDNKSIKILLNEIIINLQALTDITNTNNENTRDILQHINNKVDNTITNINNNGDITQDNNLTDFIKKQNLQNKIITNKLDNVIKAIT